MREAIIISVGILVVTLSIWALVQIIGKHLEPTVTHHPLEHANCYTAGKMFNISIACVARHD